MKKYCIRKCIPIRHGNDDKFSNSHIHTVEICVYAKPHETSSDIEESKRLDKLVSDCLEPFYNRYLNELPGFENDTSIERLGELIFYDMDIAFEKQATDLERVEISETPLRTYIVTKVVY